MCTQEEAKAETTEITINKAPQRYKRYWLALQNSFSRQQPAEVGSLPNKYKNEYKPAIVRINVNKLSYSFGYINEITVKVLNLTRNTLYKNNNNI